MKCAINKLLQLLCELLFKHLVKRTCYLKKIHQLDSDSGQDSVQLAFIWDSTGLRFLSPRQFGLVSRTLASVITGNSFLCSLFFLMQREADRSGTGSAHRLHVILQGGVWLQIPSQHPGCTISARTASVFVDFLVARRSGLWRAADPIMGAAQAAQRADAEAEEEQHTQVSPWSFCTKFTTFIRIGIWAVRQEAADPGSVVVVRTGQVWSQVF